MAKLIKKDIIDNDGGAVYRAVFDGEPTMAEIDQARAQPIKHGCFSGIVEIPFLEKIEDGTLKEGYHAYMIGQCS